MMILRVTKNQGFTLSLENTFFKKRVKGLNYAYCLWEETLANVTSDNG